MESAPPMSSIGLSSTYINDGGAREFLLVEKWPAGLQEVFVNNCTKVGFRSFICDDSGSMMHEDGSRLVKDPSGNHKLIKCSRWDELTDAMRFHVNLARAAGVPSEFRLLNAAAPVMVGTNGEDDFNNYNTLMNAFKGSPSGGTPLCRHVREFTEMVRNMEVELRAHGQKALIVIATDGEASDGNIVDAMRPLKDLPVWVVLRLCTSDDSIVEYWNNIDKELELDMDVLDDFKGEAKEIAHKNPWLTYGEPLHRLREFGVSCKELDLLDESKLSMEQVRKVCMMIYGGNEEKFTHPEVNWTKFIEEIERENAHSYTWCALTGHPAKWITVKKLSKHKGGCVIM